MSDKLDSYVYGDTDPRVTKAVPSLVTVSIGDLVFAADDSSGIGDEAGGNVVVGSPIPADQTPWQSTLAGTQEWFHDRFLGVACQRSRSGDVDPVRVATKGRFRFTCESATFKVGDLVGPAQAGATQALSPQKVVAVATPNLAIGRIGKDYPSAVTEVEVEVESTVVHGGPQAAA